MRLIENHWYPVVESREVGRRPGMFERLGQKLVIWRTDEGGPVVQTDRCPHLGASLSKGKVSRDRIVCPFHGFEFDAQGQCTYIPANGRKGKIPKEIGVKTLTIREAHGLIWVWWGRAVENFPPLPFFSELENGWRYGTVTAEWPVHYSRAIENQLDVAHLSFVHRTTIGRGGRTFVDGPYVEADFSGIKIWVTNSEDEGRPHRDMQDLAVEAQSREPGLHFLFPGLWLLNISPRLKNFVVFVPVNEGRTRFYVRVYHRAENPLAAKVLEFFLGLSNRFILNQDRRIVITQTPKDSGLARDDHVIGADRAIIQFRRLRAKLLAESEIGASVGAYAEDEPSEHE